MDAKSFFELDFYAFLFPMKTNLLLIQNHHQAIEQYIAKILSADPAHVADNFLSQVRVHAAKPKNHLRRTVVLDPVASYFLYDLVYRNRAAFGIAGPTTRTSFGYRFEANHPIPVHKAYKDFTQQVDWMRNGVYGHMVSFDVASYFNSIYHHDATHWFSSLPGVSGPDANAFGRFFREINSGRSIDFLPQGIYPAKMIGSEFLRFIEHSGQVKCAQSLRFMDDIYLFDDDLNVLTQDFIRIQELLGLRSLNVNPTKTSVDGDDKTIQEKASHIKLEIAAMLEDDDVPTIYLGSGADGGPYKGGEFDEPDDDAGLDKAQVERLLELLVDPKVEEEDVEVILGILHDHSDSVKTLIPSLIARFPNIVKQMHKLAGQVAAKDDLTNQLIELLKVETALLEYQLFWIVMIAEDHLGHTQNFGKLVMRLYELTSDHKIARAKILEIPDQSFGLKEIRAEILKSGASDWSSWAAAVGTRTLQKAERNYAMTYFSKGSPLNRLIAECVQNL
jgi:hypothetical protein